MKTQLDHVGIAVHSLAEAIPAFEAVLGVTASEVEVVADQKVRVVFLKAGEPGIELLESTGPDGPIGKFLAKRGEGIHHLSFEVDDLNAALARCRAASLNLIDEQPRKGAAGKLIAFLHPKSTNGVLIELSQTIAPPPQSSRPPADRSPIQSSD
ncbi:MAG: methylmalonyl-CoA epimerase [Candidatus Eisenbacteria bacterium]|nr:methylmalonyl-CoA epimerase [Candidatus Eisenbacteria bacterium]